MQFFNLPACQRLGVKLSSEVDSTSYVGAAASIDGKVVGLIVGTFVESGGNVPSAVSEN